MNPLEQTIHRIAAELDAVGVSWALVGGLAVSARAEPRTTRDIDIAVAVQDDRQAENLVADLRARGFPVDSLIEQTATKRLATARLHSTASSIVVDLLFASSGIEAETVTDAELLEILPGLRIRVARIPHLIALKVLARDDRLRPQDWDDLRALTAEGTDADIDEARSLLEKITRRGFHRNRDLTAALDAFLSSRPK